LLHSRSSFTPRARPEREKAARQHSFIGSSLVPFWIGQEQGIFAKHGIDVELIWMQSNLSTAALLAGEVDTHGTPVAVRRADSEKSAAVDDHRRMGSSSEHWLVVNPAISSQKIGR
jgi:ABC-type nitrate/sulfonate/bicarbonate transport system substrate-binding protein